jgi:hypothetical protein
MANIIANVKITGLKEMIDKLRRQGVNINEGLRNAVADAAAMAVNTITELAPHKTGRLARSINAKFQDNGLTARIGTNVKYAAIQEFGGFVRAKNVKNLTIPLNREAELTTARRLMDSGRGAIFKSKAGNLIMWKKTDAGKVVPMYLLRPSVFIRPHPYMRPGMMSVRPYFLQKVQEYVSRA